MIIVRFTILLNISRLNRLMHFGVPVTRWGLGAVLSVFLLCPVEAAQVWRSKNIYFGDMHWHSCLSQDAPRATTITGQYESMVYDYGLDFSMQSEHAEAATAGIRECGTYLPRTLIPGPNGPMLKVYSGEELATAMKQAADDWNGAQNNGNTFVTFPGYEWAPDARCWQASPLNPFPNDLNSDDNTPGHINYFFSTTQGWTYHDDVWEPGDGDSDTCATATALGLTYYNGSKDWVDEILGQLIHQRDDPDRDYDLLIQYNHPAASIDKGGTSDHLAKWYDFEHNSNYCSVAEGGPACGETQCEALRRAYGVTSVEWYAKQEASIGSREIHGTTGEACTGNLLTDIFSEYCSHSVLHIADRYVMSRGLREGYDLAAVGGSDSHSGRRFAPNGFPGSRGAGSGSLAVVYAGGSTREEIWDGMTVRHSYGLSRLREIGPVHKGRVDFYTVEPTGAEFVMGDTVGAAPQGETRDFTISAAAESGSLGVYPVELRLYRVGPATPLTQRTDLTFYWLDDIPDDPGKFGELLGKFVNSDGSSTLTHTFTNITVHPGDAIFAVVPYSDYTWIDDFYDTNQDPLDADRDGHPDDGKTGFQHNDNNTWARTTPIFFEASQEAAQASPSCAHVAFSGSGTVVPGGAGGGDALLAGDQDVLPVALPSVGYELEWNRWRFDLPQDSNFVDLSFLTEKDEDNTGHVFAVRIDGRLVYSGRAGIDHQADVIVDMKNIPFALKRGVHELQVHMDDQEYANGDNDPDFHCNDYDGPPAFVDSVNFHNGASALCGDVTPPVIQCPSDITVECNAFGGAPSSSAQIAAFLAGASATDNLDLSPTITHNSPSFFETGVTAVTFTAADDAGNTATCSASVTVADTTPPTLDAFALSPTKLSPPRHQLVGIRVPPLVARDICDAAPKIFCSVGSNEPPNGLGDGDYPIDIVFNGQPIATQATGIREIATSNGKGTFALRLRAERGGSGNGRIYTTSCAARDSSGNVGVTRTSIVGVPK